MDKAFARAGHAKEHKEAMRCIVRKTRDFEKSAPASAGVLLSPNAPAAIGGGGGSALDEAPKRYADVKAAMPPQLLATPKRGGGGGPDRWSAAGEVVGIAALVPGDDGDL